MKFQARLDLVPELPGVYQLKDKLGTIIYIGKAINLKKRLASYFNKREQPSYRIALLVEKVVDFDFVVCGNELEALILESGFIKQYQPFYNILLKDDRDYPYLLLDYNKHRPGFKKVFRKDKQQSNTKKFFGPYLSSDLLKIKKTLSEIFALNNCGYFYPKEKNKACFGSHIGACIGTCCGKVDVLEYHRRLSQAERVLNFEDEKLISDIYEQMLSKAAELDFERADYLKKQYEALHNLYQKQRIVASQEFDADFLALKLDEESSIICLQLLEVRKGRIKGGKTYFFNANDLVITLKNFLQQHYIEPFLNCADLNSTKDIAFWTQKQISLLQQQFGKKRQLFLADDFSNLELDEALKEFLTLSFPQKGSKKEILEIAIQTVNEALQRKKLLNLSRNDKTKIDLALQSLKTIFALKKIPTRIEAYDVSNLQDKGTVCSMAVFLDGKFAKKAYRQFNLTDKNPENFSGNQVPNDYDSIKQALSRRLKYLTDSEKQASQAKIPFGMDQKPDLILLDGGKQHVALGQKILAEMKLDNQIALGGIVKNNKHQTRGLVDHTKKIWELLKAREQNNATLCADLTKQSIIDLLAFLTKVQDKIHHKAKQGMYKTISQTQFNSGLVSIKGIGEQRRKKLMTVFSDLTELKQADINKIQAKTGFSPKICQAIYEYFQKNE